MFDYIHFEIYLIFSSITSLELCCGYGTIINLKFISHHVVHYMVTFHLTLVANKLLVTQF